MLWVELETLEIFQKILFVKMISIYYFLLIHINYFVFLQATKF